MKFSILLPHYKTAKMTAYTISQLQKYKGRHEIDIIVIDNSNGEGLELIKPDNNIIIVTYPPELMQSHGIAFDFALEHIPTITEYFITIESDSFPTSDRWLDMYETLINEGYDMAGSRLKLSGGEYIHPAGAMYKKSNWRQALEEVRWMNVKWNYYPNLGMKEGHPCHIMSQSILTDFTHKHSSYDNNSFESQLKTYLPISKSVFHQAMGGLQESFYTYGHRDISTGISDLQVPMNDEIIYRLGYEPGQWFSYWHYATGKKVKQVNTEIEWMQGRRNQQQEYTLMVNGFKHLWGVSAYHNVDSETVKDIVNRKRQLVDELYASIQS